MLNLLDRKHINILLKAEKALPKKKKYPYSPTLIASTMLHAYWRQRLNHKNKLTKKSEESELKYLELLKENNIGPYQGMGQMSESQYLRRASKSLRKHRL